MYLIYKTDNWHSHASRDLIGVASRKNPLTLIKEQAKKEGVKLTKDDLFNINTYNQTQGYNGDGEFHIEHVEKDILL